MSEIKETLIDIEIEINGVDIECEAEFTATPFIPAFVCAAPEDCYDSEGGEIKVTGLTCEHGCLSVLLGDKEINETIVNRVADALHF